MTTYETNASLTYRQDLTDDLVIIRVVPDDENFPSFEPGQYVELSIIEASPPGENGKPKEKLVRKQYSLASTPNDPQGLELYVTLVPYGDLTPKLWRLYEGDRLWINNKVKGKFTLNAVPPGKDLVLVSTGTGVAPFVSMVRTYRHDPPWRRVVLVHGVRYAKDLGYREELEQTAEEDARVSYIPIVSREPSDSSWPGLRGRVQKVFEEDHYRQQVGVPFSPEDCQVMLCGNPEMINDMQRFLEERGFKAHRKKEPGNIHIERYW